MLFVVWSVLCVVRGALLVVRCLLYDGRSLVVVRRWSRFVVWCVCFVLFAVGVFVVVCC